MHSAGTMLSSALRALNRPYSGSLKRAENITRDDLRRMLTGAVACNRFERQTQPNLVHNFARLRLHPMNSIPRRGYFKCSRSKELEEGFKTASSPVQRTIQRSFSIRIFVVLMRQERNLTLSSSQLSERDSGKLVLWTSLTSKKRLATSRRKNAISALQAAGFLLDLLHRPRQHPRTVPQQTAVGRIVDIGFHHRGIDPQLSPTRHSLFLRQLHDPLVQLLDHFRPDELPQPRHGLGIGHFAVSYSRKRAIHQIGPHFSLQRVIAPVANVFQQQQTQHHFGRSLLAASPAALRIPFALRLINRVQQLLIFQQTVHQPHPRLPQILDICRQTGVPQRWLLMA